LPRKLRHRSRLHPAPTRPHRSRRDGVAAVGEQKMMLRSALALGMLGLAFGAAQAQPYPPPYRAPAPTMADDDDDDLPPNLRAAPGNYPPPPGGYVFPHDQRATVPGGIQREALPAPGGATAPAYGPP